MGGAQLGVCDSSGKRIGRDLFLAVLAGLLACANSAPAQNFECSPSAFPVKNFAREIEIVQDDAGELSELFRGRQRQVLYQALPDDLARLREPRMLYTGHTVLLQKLRGVHSDSTIFNWENTTKAVLAGVENDLRNLRVSVLKSSDVTVALLRQTTADAERVSGFFNSALGLMVKLRHDSDGVRDKYMDRAFNHLNSCLSSCAGPGPKGRFNLAAFRIGLAEMYTASSSKTFAESAKELADGKTAMESLVKELNADISPAKTESWNTTVFSAAEAASLQRAADTLADAKSGSWVSIGSNNDKIQQAIAALSIGYQVVNRPDPVQLTKSAIDRAKTAQANIDTFLLAHDRLVGNLRAFLAQYATSYQPGCFAKSARSQNHQPNSKDWS